MSWQPVQPGLEHPGSRLKGRGKAGTWWLEMELFPEGGGKGETGKGQEWAWAKPHPLTIAGATSRCTLGPGCTRSRKTGRTCGWVKRGPVVGGALTPDPGPVPSPPPPACFPRVSIVLIPSGEGIKMGQNRDQELLPYPF